MYCPALQSRGGGESGPATREKPSRARLPTEALMLEGNIGKGQAGVATGPREFRRPLAKDADKTISRQEPWKAEGMSRASWYRRQAEKKS